MENTTALLSTAYFAPIQYYCKLIQYPNVMIEQWENYSKQSYRNRCNIYGANGALAISVPVVKATNKKVLTKDVKISYDTNWQKLHWKGIESAYKSSPFYEYYIDDLERFFNQKWDFLLDFNLEIQTEISEILEIENKHSLTEDFIPLDAPDITDFRNVIHPKPSKGINDTEFAPQFYTQVFGDKHGFIPNLSILDLIFNLGPDSSYYLESCLK
ncbi:WbqC family protein [Marinifilum fragile]|uniref:WbqC family protein n=1 Tax=Marinifilum fragile TaxID=570161 RepID=UPI002AA6F2F6|nr:WbqC family protein [Marinifilum fragile]